MILSLQCGTFYFIPINKTTTAPTLDEPLATLQQETLKHLDAVESELDRADADLKAMEEIGIDTSRLREKIDWGRKARKVILDRFGPKK